MRHATWNVLAINVALTMTTSAMADNVFIEIEPFTSNECLPAGDPGHDFEYGDFDSTGLMGARIYLAGVPADWSLQAVFGDERSPMTIATDDGSVFFNAADLSPFYAPPSPKILPPFPQQQWDTFLTIGGEADTAVSPGFPNIALEDGGESIVNNAGIAWFDMDPGTPVFPDGDGRILIGQLTFNEGVFVNMNINAQFSNAKGESVQVRDLSGPFAQPEPCPADFNGDDTVGTSDLLTLLSMWGEKIEALDIGGSDCGDGMVGVEDLLALLAAWGDCE